MDYQQEYINLILKYESKPINPTVIYEEHHIVATCTLDGKIPNNDSNNIINLPIREHLKAHELLWNIYLGTKHEFNLWYAYWYTYIRINGKNDNDFIRMRSRCSNYMIEFWKNPENKKKLIKSITGLTRSEKTKRKISEYNKNRTPNHIQNLIKAKHSEEYRQKMTQSLSGKPKPEGFGNKISNLLKGRHYQTEKSKLLIGEKQKNKKKNLSIKNINILTLKTLNCLDQKLIQKYDLIEEEETIKKKCKECNKYFTLDNFFKEKTMKIGIQNLCKQCWRIHYHKSYDLDTSTPPII